MIQVWYIYHKTSRSVPYVKVLSQVMDQVPLCFNYKKKMFAKRCFGLHMHVSIEDFITATMALIKLAQAILVCITQQWKCHHQLAMLMTRKLVFAFHHSEMYFSSDMSNTHSYRRGQRVEILVLILLGSRETRTATRQTRNLHAGKGLSNF